MESTTFNGIRALTAAACAAIAGVIADSPAAHGSGLDQTLINAMADTQKNEIISSLIFLTDQADVQALARELDAARAPRNRRNREVIRTLYDTANLTQRDLIAHLDAL